jgi:hypothetical protein
MNSSHIKILEFYNHSTDEIILAGIEAVGWKHLEHYSIHKFARNYSEVEGISRREVH